MKTREMLVQAANALGDLSSRVVFTGGATIAEYLDQPALEAPRPTLDVDVVVELATRREYNAVMAELDMCGWTHPQLEGSLVSEIAAGSAKLRGFVREWANTLRVLGDYEQVVEAHIHPSLVRAGRLDVVLEVIDALAE
jgi:hypothetical protein